MDTLIASCISNAIGITLLLTLFISNNSNYRGDRETRGVFRMGYISVISCFADATARFLDYHNGTLFTVLIYILNSWLFLANILIGCAWVEFIANHVGAKIEKVRKIIYIVIVSCASLLLVFNCFTPLVFSATDNIYKRGTFFWLYIMISGIFILDSVIIFFKSKKRSGMLISFPIFAFFFPIILGVTFQSIFPEISVIWASITILIAGLIASLKNEVIYKDNLTGVYNRHYLDKLKKRIAKNHNHKITGIMLDINNFKHINDTYGHATGDKALIDAAKVFIDALDGSGRVIRYAGDEFLIVLNSSDKDEIEDLLTRINNGFEKLNNKGVNQYNLSVSTGHEILNLEKQSIDEFLNLIDDKMYENKYKNKYNIDETKKAAISLDGNKNNKKILVIESPLENKRKIADALEGTYPLFIAENSFEGFDILSSCYKEICLAIVELNNPVCDGFRILSKISEDSILTNIPIVIVSDRSNFDEEIECLKLGAIDIIHKPFNEEVFLRRIRNIIKLNDLKPSIADIEVDKLTGLYTMPAFYHHTNVQVRANPEADYSIMLIDVIDYNKFYHILGERESEKFLSDICDYLRSCNKDGIFTRSGDKIYAFFKSDYNLDMDYINETICKKSNVVMKLNAVIYNNIDTSHSVRFYFGRLLTVAENTKHDYTTCIHYYDTNAQKQIDENQYIEVNFESALKDGKIKPYFQPKVDAASEKISGAEALARWIKEDGSVIPPNKFIPVLEKCGTVKQLDEYMFNAVCDYQKKCIDNGLKVLPVSVNISRLSVYSEDTAQRYFNILKEKNVPISAIPLELTESAAVENEEIRTSLNKFVSLGFTLYLDDFGTGYSSLTDLSVLPFSSIKLDKTIVDYAKYDNGKAIVDSIISLAHRINLTVIAEGVETKELHDFLKESSCDAFQCFYYYQPQEINDFEKLINS